MPQYQRPATHTKAQITERAVQTCTAAGVLEYVTRSMDYMFPIWYAGTYNHRGLAELSTPKLRKAAECHRGGYQEHLWNNRACRNHGKQIMCLVLILYVFRVLCLGSFSIQGFIYVRVAFFILKR